MVNFPFIVISHCCYFFFVHKTLYLIKKLVHLKYVKCSFYWIHLRTIISGLVSDCIPSIDACNGKNQCFNGGTCVLSSDDFICTCPPGFTGNWSHLILFVYSTCI